MPNTTSADGTAISYTVTGTGPALVMVSGATHFRAIDPTLVELGELLADRITFITYDRRGRGDSGDTPPYAPEREIEDLAAVIEATGGEAAVYGHSSGAALALEAAAAGLPISRLFLYEPPFRTDPDDPLRLPGDYVETLDSHIASGDRDGAATYFFHHVGLSDQDIAGMRHSPFWSVVQGVAPTLAYDGHFMTRALRDGRFTERWAAVTQRVEVVSGDQTFPYIAAAAPRVAAALPNASVAVLPGQGHGPAAEALASLLRAFMG